MNQMKYKNVQHDSFGIRNIAKSVILLEFSLKYNAFYLIKFIYRDMKG